MKIPILIAVIRTRGRKPSNALITYHLTEGILVMRRATLRNYVTCILEDNELVELIESGDPFWSNFKEVYIWAKQAKVVYLNEEQRNVIYERTSKIQT